MGVESIIEYALRIRELRDRKSTRLNSSHVEISYAVFCLKKKKTFPFRSSPVNDNPEMCELHSEYPALELTPGRYALVLKIFFNDSGARGDPLYPSPRLLRI